MHFAIIKQTIRALSLNYKQTSGVMVAIWQHSRSQPARFVRRAFPLRLSRPGPAKPRWTALAGAAKSILWAGI
jgi:hypothetical protein